MNEIFERNSLSYLTDIQRRFYEICLAARSEAMFMGYRL